VKMDNELLERIKEYGDKVEKFEAGVTYIPVDNSISNGDESINLIASVLGSNQDYLRSFCYKLNNYMGHGHISITGNSASAHLLTMKALSSPQLGSRRLGVGDEVITTPNSVAVINACQTFGIVPILVDVDLNTMLPNPIEIEMKVVEGKTKAIILPSICGNSVIGEEIRDIADDFSIMFIEDFGYGFGGKVYGVPVGSYADVCIYSFHSNLLGDAGVIICKQHLVHQIIENLMKEDNSSNWMGLGSSPMMYAYLDAQMDKHEFYFSQRRINWIRLYEGLGKYSKYFRFHKTLPRVNPSWTGFIITIKIPAPFTKTDIMQFLDGKKIGTRSVIGNVFQVESYKEFNKDGDDELINSNYIHENSFIIGCNPDMRQEHIDWVIKSIGEFLETYERKEEIKD